jgi:hypothetical protein
VFHLEMKSQWNTEVRMELQRQVYLWSAWIAAVG